MLRGRVDGDSSKEKRAGMGGDGVSVDSAGRNGDTFSSPCSSLIDIKAV